MIYFDSRNAAREFARKNALYRALDLKDTGRNRRWGVLILGNNPQGAKAA